MNDTYAVVDMSKKSQKSKSVPQQSPSHNLSMDLYAVVDKSKKTKNKNEPSPQEHPSLDPVMDLYAVVDKSKKSKPVPQSVDDQNTCDAVAPEELHCNSVENTTSAYDAAMYDSVPVYSLQGRNQVPESMLIQSVTNKEQSSSRFQYNLARLKIGDLNKRNFSITHVKVLACLIILLAIVVAAAVALVVAFMNIASLQSDIADIESMNVLRTSFNKLDHEFQIFVYENEQKIKALLNYTIITTAKLEYQTNKITNTKVRLYEIQDDVKIAITNLKTNLRNLSTDFVEYASNITSILNKFTDEISKSIRSASNMAQTSVADLTTKLLQDIQEFYVFESCDVIKKLSLPFISNNTFGIFMIKSSSGSPNSVHCSTGVILSCDGITGGWRRVAYLNTTNTTMPQCPTGLVARTDPPSCRRESLAAGCSSVTYHTEGSFSCVFGRILARQSGNPDAFRYRYIEAIQDKYVDGVSLTHGNNPMNHIWTFAAGIYFPSEEMNTCNVCTWHRPADIGNDYSCEINTLCSGSTVCGDPLWDGDQCFGNGTFYRKLTQSTSDNIEMRVCRDQDQNDEDILITFVELYVQ